MKRQTVFAIICSLVIAPTALAQTDSRGFEIDPSFNPDAVLTDTDVYDMSGMTLASMTSFLRAKGTLADYHTTDIDGIVRSAPEIIWHMAQMYQVNPKYLLALLQKEQSLVEDPNPSPDQYDWAAGFGVCDSCSKNDPAIRDYKGFANQMYYAARQMREKYYLRILTEGKTIAGVGPGISTTIDGISVTPANAATAALYSYTPHIHGNQNLWHIWQRWFSKQYPDGTVVKGMPSKKIWWIRYGVKRPFASMAVANSLVDLSKAVQASDSELSAYADGEPIAFPNYALLREPSGNIWLLIGNERRRIADMKTFTSYGFNMDEVEDITAEDLESYDIGDPITLSTAYPTGQLVQVKGEKGVWYAEAGTKHAITHPALLSLYFPGQRPKQITRETLDKLTTKTPYALHDGELVKAASAPAVYVIENGLKRPIASGDDFEGMGWKWSNVAALPASLLDGYDTGEVVTLHPVTPTDTLALGSASSTAATSTVALTSSD